MKKLFSFIIFIISFTVNAQIANSGTNNSGATASAIGHKQQQVELLQQQWAVRLRQVETILQR